MVCMWVQNVGTVEEMMFVVCVIVTECGYS